MSVDVFQEKIRKTKNPSVLVLEAFSDNVPPQLLETLSLAEACREYYGQLLAALKTVMPAVRFGFGSFALLGAEGIATLSCLTARAKELGYYVLVDGPETLSVMAAENLAAMLGGKKAPFVCDGVILPVYSGSDIIKPFLPLCRKGMSIFPVVRTANKSATEIQDLLTGTRLVHTALADIIYRQGEGIVGRCGYSQVGALAAASAADSLRSLRAKYTRMFLLLDGYDYPNANAKNCSYAFDKLGHGAAACAGSSIVGAWKNGEAEDPFAAAAEAAERMKKNLTRYVTIL